MSLTELLLSNMGSSPLANAPEHLVQKHFKELSKVNGLPLWLLAALRRFDSDLSKGVKFDQAASTFNKAIGLKRTGRPKAITLDEVKAFYRSGISNDELWCAINQDPNHSNVDYQKIEELAAQLRKHEKGEREFAESAMPEFIARMEALVPKDFAERFHEQRERWMKNKPNGVSESEWGSVFGQLPPSDILEEELVQAHMDFAKQVVCAHLKFEEKIKTLKSS